jgi:hypothetical protein
MNWPRRIKPSDIHRIKQKLPRSIFTKKMTAARTVGLLRSLRGMTPEEREICRLKGWDRGLLS